MRSGFKKTIIDMYGLGAPALDQVIQAMESNPSSCCRYWYRGNGSYFLIVEVPHPDGRMVINITDPKWPRKKLPMKDEDYISHPSLEEIAQLLSKLVIYSANLKKVFHSRDGVFTKIVDLDFSLCGDGYAESAEPGIDLRNLLEILDSDEIVCKFKKRWDHVLEYFKVSPLLPRKRFIFEM